jgi:hypothetical protein
MGAEEGSKVSTACGAGGLAAGSSEGGLKQYRKTRTSGF